MLDPDNFGTLTGGTESGRSLPFMVNFQDGKDTDWVQVNAFVRQLLSAWNHTDPPGARPELSPRAPPPFPTPIDH